jgi:O-antigen ligase
VVGIVALPTIFANIDLGTSLDRFHEIRFAAETDRFAGRLDIWEGAIDAFCNAPLLGHGVGQFVNIIGNNCVRINVAHSVYLGVACEQGVVGLGLFLATIGFGIWSIFKYPSQSRPIWLTVFASWFIMSMSLSWEYVPQTWLLPGIIVAGAYALEPVNAPQSSPLELPNAGSTKASDGERVVTFS